MSAEGPAQAAGRQAGGTWMMGCRQQLPAAVHLGGIGLGEADGLRQGLTLAGRRARAALRTARREQVVRSSWWIAARWLRKRLFSARRMRGKMQQAAAQAHPSVHCRDEAVGTAGRRHVVVVGDSLGAGLGDSVRGLELVGWADRLAVALRTHHAGACLTNLARSGLTTAEIIHTQLDHAMTLRPHVIVVTAGGNDLLARTWDPVAFRRAYRALLEPLLAGGATVLTTTWHDVPLAVPMPPALARRFSRRICEASFVVRQVSHELGAPCLDFWHMPDLLDAGCYSSDGIHPNARGYLRVAEVVADGLGRYAGMPVPFSALRSLPEHGLDRPARATRVGEPGTDRATAFLKRTMASLYGNGYPARLE